MDFSQFQFSQSAWLWGLLVIPLVILLYILFCKADSAKLLERFADQHLLPHLVKTRTVTGGGVRLSLLLWAVAWLCGVVAMAGPRWSYTDVPTFREAQSLVIVLDLSQTMNETDVKPSRIARAREEIQDLLDLSRGVSIGLVAYAAVPHMVTPLTDDLRTIKNLLPALDTSLVTIQGDRLKPALEMAAGMLKAQPGEDKSILVISDGGFEESDFAELAKAAGNATIYTMGIGGTMPLPGLGDGGERSQDTAGKKAIPLRADPLLRLATAGHGLYVEANYTDSDTRAVLGSIDAANVKTQTSPNMARVWDERFYIPVLALALLLLPLFRKGASFLAVILLAANFCFLAPARAASVTDLFLNKEEQAQAAYDRGDFKGAMAKFDTPYRQGVAAYRAGAYERAAILFKAAASQNGGLNALYDLGNAELMQGQVEDAIASYEAVLKQKPGHLGARHNLALALKMLPQKQDPQKKQDKNKSGDNKQGQNKQQGQQQSQQQGKNGQRSNQSPKSGAGNSARAKQSKDNQQAAQQRGQQQAGQQKPQQQAGLQQASPQGVKQRGAGAPQNSEIGMAASGPPCTQQDIDADEWLGRVQSDPGSFLRNQFIIEDRKSGLKQNAPPG